jgi:FKBP-type peptidyl-prolyl cis-trans isomerase 2
MINDNDFVLVNFVGRISLTGKIFDLTYKDMAEKEGLSGENYSFKPMLVIPRANYTLKSIAESVIGKNVSDKYKLDIKAKDAFGEQNPKLLHTYGMGTFIENNIRPSPGDVVMLDDRVATVLSVVGGRVLVSFNHPLAGKDLSYEIEIVGVITGEKDKCEAVFEHYSGKKPNELTIEEKNVKIVTEKAPLTYIKDAIVSDIRKYVDKDLSVEIIP